MRNNKIQSSKEIKNVQKQYQLSSSIPSVICKCKINVFNLNLFFLVVTSYNLGQK